MNRKVIRRLLVAELALAGALFAALPLVGVADTRDEEISTAPAANTLTDSERAAGWRLLFDGKSTTHWRTYKESKFSRKWQVKDGALVLTGRGGGDNIITREKFGSYELVLDYKISRDGNSGLMFHVCEFCGPPHRTGPEIQIRDNASRQPQKSGWVYGLYQPPMDAKTGQPVDATKPAGQWNQLRLLIDGPHVEVDVNGARYASFEIGSDDWKRRVAASEFAQWPQFGKSKSGHICLQDLGDEVAYRNIKIRPIKAK